MKLLLLPLLLIIFITGCATCKDAEKDAINELLTCKASCEKGMSWYEGDRKKCVCN